MKRATLHRSHLEEFKAWLERDGWTLSPTLRDWEVVRALKGKRLFLAFDRSKGDHFTVQDSMLGVVAAFLNDRRKSA